MRVFAGRSSVGVRGITLRDDDLVISMSVLRHEELRSQNGDEGESATESTPQADDAESDAMVAEEDVDSVQAGEFVLSVTEKGFGVRVSPSRYRITGRGGLGIENMKLRKGDAVTAVFPVGPKDQIMLVTDSGMVIRCPVHDIRIAHRRTQGVVIFRVGEGERVVSVARLPEVSEGNGEVDGSDDSADDQQANQGDT